MSPNLLMQLSPQGYSVYQGNQDLFDTQKLALDSPKK
jgi:hypothetical protein